MQEKTYTVEYTAAEMQALGQLLDLAVKAGGLSVAEPALVITKKLQAAAQAKDAAPPVEAPVVN